MATSIGVGLSTSPDSFMAGRKAAEIARGTLQACENCLIIVFATENYDHRQMLLGIKSVIDTENIVGFTVPGVFNAEVVETEGVVLGVIESDDLEFQLASEQGLSDDQQGSGRRLGAAFGPSLTGAENAVLQLLFPDGITNTVSGMLDALFSMLGSRSKYAGGGSGDNLRFLKTSQYLGEQVLKDAVVAVQIKACKPIGVALSHGWEPVSPPMIVTKSENNQVKELDWQSAYQVYADFAQSEAKISLNNTDFATFAMHHPFGIPQAKEGDGYVVRDPISTEPDGSIACVGEVPENSVLRILTGNRESLLAAVKDGAREAKQQLGDNPIAGVLIFTCVSRCVLLKEDFIDEIKAVREIFGVEVPIFGCMSFGEIGAIGSGPPEFHNKSVVICAFPE